MLTPRTMVRRSLLTIGRRLSPPTFASMRIVLGWLELGRWLADQPGSPHPPPESESKFELFDNALTYLKGARTLYLEFGVYEGKTLRWWAEHLTNPSSQFVGFDSFEGLPEDWRPGGRVGEFRTAGPPSIDDSRVSYVVGWFDDTLPAYKPPEHDQLVLNVDCDLYSSARTVLEWAEPYLRPGTLVFFDELVDSHHEMRAFVESLAKSGRQVTPLGYSGWRWLFRYE